MKNNKKLIDLITKIILSVSTLIVGILFVVQASRLYFDRKDSGSQIYTPEIVSQYFEPIKIITFVYFGILVAGIVVALVLAKDNIKFKHDDADIIKYEKARFKAAKIESAEIKKIEKVRLIRLIVLLVILVLCLLMCCLFIFNPKSFTSTGDLIQEAVNMVVHLLPWVLFSFAALCLYYFTSLPIDREEVKIIRKLLAGKKIEKKQNNWKLWAIRGVIFAIAVTFILIGVFNEGAQDVLMKAISICTECIGLG